MIINSRFPAGEIPKRQCHEQHVQQVDAKKRTNRELTESARELKKLRKESRDAEAAVQLYLSLTQDRTKDVSIAVAERFIPPDGKINNQERIKAGSRLIAKAVCIGVARELVPHPQKMTNQEKIMEASRLKASFTVAACKHVKGRVEQLEVLSKVMKAVTDRMSINKLQAKTEQAEANKGKINDG